MKAIFAVYNIAYNEEIVAILSAHGQRGYTKWDTILGCGSQTGEPHLGSHAWPTQNQALLTIVPDDKVDVLLSDIKAKDEANPDLGLRAFVLPVERVV